MLFTKEDIGAILGGTIPIDDLKRFTPEDVRSLKAEGDRMVIRANLHTLDGAGAKALKPKTGDEEARTVEHTASNFEKDRLGDRIDPRGWDLRAFRSNSQLLFGHRDHQPPIGRVLQARKTAGETGELATLSRFHEKAKYDFADLIFRMVIDGDLPAVSVGFMPTLVERPKSEEEAVALGVGRWGVVYRKQELLELSVVTVPALSTALAKSIRRWEESGQVDATALRLLERYLANDEPTKTIHRLGGPMCEVIDENVDPAHELAAAAARTVDASLTSFDVGPAIAALKDSADAIAALMRGAPVEGTIEIEGEERVVDFDELRALVREEVRDGFDAAVRNIKDNDTPNGDSRGSADGSEALEPGLSPEPEGRSAGSDPESEFDLVLEAATREAASQNKED